MFRLTLIPFVLVFGALFFGIISYIVIRNIKKGLQYTVKKGAELASKQQQKWTEKEQRKKLPDILQKAFSQYEQLTALKPSLVITVCQVRLPMRLAKASSTRRVFGSDFFSHWETNMTIIICLPLSPHPSPLLRGEGVFCI